MNRFRRLLRDERGQAMAEYGILTTVLLIGTIAVGGTGFVAKFPGMNVTLAQAIYASIQVYVDSFYYSLHLMAP